MAEVYRPVSILPVGTATARYIQALASAATTSIPPCRRPRRGAIRRKSKPRSSCGPKARRPAEARRMRRGPDPSRRMASARKRSASCAGCRFSARSKARCRRFLFSTKIPVETGTGITGGWVAERAAIPVQKTAFVTSVEEYYKYGAIAVISEELGHDLQDPATVPTINRLVLGPLAKAIDNQLLLPTITAVANTNLASILAGSTEIHHNPGSTLATISADLTGMLAAVTTPDRLSVVNGSSSSQRARARAMPRGALQAPLRDRNPIRCGATAGCSKTGRLQHRQSSDTPRRVTP